MEWLAWLLFLGGLWAFGAQWDAGIKHRRLARQAGQETHSLWWHVRAAPKQARKPNPVSKPASDRIAAYQEQSRKAVDLSSRGRKIGSGPFPSNTSQPKRLEKTERNKKRLAEQRERSRQARASEKPAESKRPVPVPGNTNLRFIYQSADGNVGERELLWWRNFSDRIIGHCLKADDVRHFRHDRIVEFLDGTDALLDTHARTSATNEAVEFSPGRSRPASAEMEILFTGFDAKKRATLEATASRHGFRVRKTVTKHLDFLCTGPRYSRTKRNQASEKAGCEIIDKDGFLWMITTGELPES